MNSRQDLKGRAALSQNTQKGRGRSELQILFLLMLAFLTRVHLRPEQSDVPDQEEPTRELRNESVSVYCGGTGKNRPASKISRKL